MNRIFQNELHIAATETLHRSCNNILSDFAGEFTAGRLQLNLTVQEDL